jgi:hypothetical protein
MNTPETARFVAIIRRIARFLGTAFAVLILAATLQCWKEFKNPEPALVSALGLLFITQAGSLIAWWREGLGSGLALAGFVGLAVLGLIRGVIDLRIVAIAIILMLPSLLFLFTWWKTRRGRSPKA